MEIERIKEDTYAKRMRRVDSGGQGDKSASELWKGQKPSIGAARHGEPDDKSPSAGGHDYMASIESDDKPKSNAADTDFMSDHSSRPAQGRREQLNSSTSSSSSPQIPDYDQESSPFDLDSNPASPATSGSAWDRIRQQATSNPSSIPPRLSRRRPVSSSAQQQRQEQQDSSTVEDSFAFSQSKEERQYAKDEAQKDFDERMEKERRGDGEGNEWGREIEEYYRL